MADLQRARSALQALRATHVAELKKRDKDMEAMRERWSKLADSQLKIVNIPSGMTWSGGVQPAAANALVAHEGEVAGVMMMASGRKEEKGAGGLAEVALEEAEKVCGVLREENGELKGLVVDTANAVRKILHRAISVDPDDVEFVGFPVLTWVYQM
jgi:hypothetical protein